jgi:DNA-binding protein HU-beta
MSITNNWDRINIGLLAQKIASMHGASHKDIRIVLNTFFDLIKDFYTSARNSDKKLIIQKFGTFYVKSMKARTGRDPNTGKAIQIKARRVLRMKPSKTLCQGIGKR